jgi:hypothetical protein
MYLRAGVLWKMKRSMIAFYKSKRKRWTKLAGISSLLVMLPSRRVALLSYNIINNINNNEIYRRGHTPAASSHTVDLAAGLEGGDVAE